MSLCCHETGRSLGVSEPVWASTRAESPQYSALGHDVVSAIPETARRPQPCAANDGGLDVHEMTGTGGSGRFVSLGTGQIGAFKFSLNAADALRYLPRSAATYNPPSA